MPAVTIGHHCVRVMRKVAIWLRSVVNLPSKTRRMAVVYRSKKKKKQKRVDFVGNVAKKNED